MKHPSLLLNSSFFACLLCIALPALTAAYEPPRTADGKPLLQGMWTNVSVTDLQRKDGVGKLVLSEDEARAIEAEDFYNIRTQEDAQPNTTEENKTLLDGSDLLSGGGYNAFWVDTGSHHARVKGEIRSSWIVDPANGRIPFSAKGRALIAERRALRSNYDGPEVRSVAERCLIGFGGTGGPPMLNVLYNNTYQIVQTPEHIMILVEMVHDARIIPIVKRNEAANEQPPAVIKPWLGNSVGWWEGDTLVVETRNWHPQQAIRGPVYMSEQGRVSERFSRYSDDQLLYEFTVEDPIYYSQPWRGEMSFNTTTGPVYEYACHEGNYALEGILNGARVKEALGEELEATDESE